MSRDNYDNVTLDLEPITPGLAKEYLEKYIKKNRPCNSRRAASMAADMTEGRWGISPPIVMTAKDGMLDGQHRMEAVVLSQKTVNFLVMRGVHEDNYKHWDSGRIRSAADTLRYAGCPSWAAANAVQLIRAWLFYSDDRLHQLSTGGGTVPITNEQVVRSWEKDKNELLHVLGWFREAGLKFMNNKGLKILYYLTAWKHPRKAKTFMANVAAPPVGDKTSPAAALNRALQNHFTAGAGSASLARLNRQQQLAYPILAWNAHMDGRDLHHLKWRPPPKDRAVDGEYVRDSFPKLKL